METRANYVMIGLFVLAVLAGAFGFVYWLYSATANAQRTTVDIVFPGTVTGLSVGGPVYFNGIRIGEVTRLSFAGQGSTAVVARTAVDPAAPLKKDVRATLGFQGLTGIAYVSLTGGTQSSPSLFEDEEVPLITADRSAFEDLLEGARDILKKADSTLTTIDKVVTENAPSITNTIKNVDQFSDALAANSDAVRTLFSDVGKAANTIANLSDRLQGIVGRVDEIVQEVKPEQVQTVIDNVVKFSDALGNAGGQIDKVVSDVTQASQDLRTFITGLNTSLAGVDRVIAAVPTESIRRIVQSVEDLTTTLGARAPDIDAFIVSARDAAASVDKVAAAVANRTDDIDAIIATVRTIADRVDALATGLGPVVSDVGRILDAVDPTRVDAIVRNVETVTSRIAVKSGEIDETIDDIRAAAASARRFADDVAGKSGDVDAIVAQTRQMMERLNAASARVSGLIDKVEALVDGDGKGLISEATAAARSIRIIADNFAPQSAAIANGFARFSSAGLTDLSAAITQARQTLMAIQNLVQQVERNPSQVIFGGSSQPTYKPQRR